MDAIWFGLLVVGVAALGMLAGGGSRRDDLRARRRWDAALEHESRRTTPQMPQGCSCAVPAVPAFRSAQGDVRAAGRCSNAASGDTPPLDLVV